VDLFQEDSSVSHLRLLFFTAFAIASAAGVAGAQVKADSVAGITNLKRLESTVACAGATTPEALRAVKEMGFASVVNLRQDSEPNANIDAESAAATGAGLRFVHLPLNPTSPDTGVVDQFVTAARDPANQPMFIHCASGNRAAAMWLIKRAVIDGWALDRATDEAEQLGLTNPALKKFAIDYATAHRKG
jgi:uncharacterized protein (TIGR01244 family)